MAYVSTPARVAAPAPASAGQGGGSKPVMLAAGPTRLGLACPAARGSGPSSGETSGPPCDARCLCCPLSTHPSPPPPSPSCRPGFARLPQSRCRTDNKACVIACPASEKGQSGQPALVKDGSDYFIRGVLSSGPTSGARAPGGPPVSGLGGWTAGCMDAWMHGWVGGWVWLSRDWPKP